MAGYGKGPASVSVFERRRPVLAVKPALQQPGEESIAGPQHVEHLDRKTGSRLSVIQIVRNRAFKRDSAGRATLADKGGLGDLAHSAQRLKRIGRTAGDMELLLGADDQIEQMQRRLQLGCYLPALDETAFAVAMSGDAP